MSSFSKHVFMYNRLHGLKQIRTKHIEKRNIFVCHKKLAEDKSKDSNAEKESVKQDETRDIPVASTKEKISNYIGEVRESRRQFNRDTEGILARPTNRDKVFLLWASKFPTREDIPEWLDTRVMIHSDNVGRVVIFLWMMSTFTIAFLVMIKLGQRRLDSLHEKIRLEQQKIWEEREKQYEKYLAESKK